MHEIKVIKSERVESLGYRTAGKCPILNNRTWSRTQRRTTTPPNVPLIIEDKNLKSEVNKNGFWTPKLGVIRVGMIIKLSVVEIQCRVSLSCFTRWLIEGKWW